MRKESTPPSSRSNQMARDDQTLSTTSTEDGERKRKLLFVAVAAFLLISVGLGVGLGVGLMGRDKNDVKPGTSPEEERTRTSPEEERTPTTDPSTIPPSSLPPQAPSPAKITSPAPSSTPFSTPFLGEDPLDPEIINRWNTNGGSGLALEIINALDENWQAELATSINDWDNGTPDAVSLTTVRVAPDSACPLEQGVIKVCNGNYGDTQWKGINEVLLSNGFIIASSAKMNDFYLEGAGVGERQYTMCHEVSVAFCIWFRGCAPVLNSILTQT